MTLIKRRLYIQRMLSYVDEKMSPLAGGERHDSEPALRLRQREEMKTGTSKTAGEENDQLGMEVKSVAPGHQKGAITEKEHNAT